MVFKMMSDGKHVKYVNGKLILNDKYKVNVNPRGQHFIDLLIIQLEKYRGKLSKKNYQNTYPHMNDFIKKFEENDRSLFEMNKKYGRHFTRKRAPRKFRQIHIVKEHIFLYMKTNSYCIRRNSTFIVQGKATVYLAQASNRLIVQTEHKKDIMFLY